MMLVNVKLNISGCNSTTFDWSSPLHLIGLLPYVHWSSPLHSLVWLLIFIGLVPYI